MNLWGGPSLVCMTVNLQAKEAPEMEGCQRNQIIRTTSNFGDEDDVQVCQRFVEIDAQPSRRNGDFQQPSSRQFYGSAQHPRADCVLVNPALQFNILVERQLHCFIFLTFFTQRHLKS